MDSEPNVSKHFSNLFYSYISLKLVTVFPKYLNSAVIFKVFVYLC